MAFWHEPKLPPLERLPPRRATASRPSWGKRGVALVSGIALAVASVVGMQHSLEAGSTRFGSFGPLALLLPAIMLVRFALTGKIKTS
jgi:hypothetical protein